MLVYCKSSNTLIEKYELLLGKQQKKGFPLGLWFDFTRPVKIYPEEQAVVLLFTGKGVTYTTKEFHSKGLFRNQEVYSEWLTEMAEQRITHVIISEDGVHKDLGLLLPTPGAMMVDYPRDLRLGVKNMQTYLANRYKYRSLPKYIRQDVLKFFNDHMFGLDDYKGELYIKDQPFIKSFERIVTGDYGAFVEFHYDDLLTELTVEPGEEWRLDEDYLMSRGLTIKYVWYNYKDVKVYRQLAGVCYADYKPKMCYVSVTDVSLPPEVLYERNKVKSFKASSKLEGIIYEDEEHAPT